MSDRAFQREKALAALQKVNAGIRFLAAKPIPIQFPNDETALAIAAIVENSGRIATALTALLSEHDRLRAALKDERETILELQRELYGPLPSGGKTRAEREIARLTAEVAILQKTVARLTKALDEASDLLAHNLPKEMT
jgi:hypothetical protein